MTPSNRDALFGAVTAVRPNRSVGQLLLYEDYARGSLGDAMKAKQSKAKQSKEKKRATTNLRTALFKGAHISTKALMLV
jgi:hypothetical protein